MAARKKKTVTRAPRRRQKLIAGDVRRFAVVHRLSKLVTNVTLWDGVSDWKPPDDSTAVMSDSAQIGDSWVSGSTFASAAPSPGFIETQDAQTIRLILGDADFDAYLATSAPTAADTVKVVRKLIRASRALARIARNEAQ